MILTAEKLAKILVDNPNSVLLYNTFRDLLPKYSVDTVNRIAGYLSQCGYESHDFTRLKENLNYSALRLRQVFPKYFPNDLIANEYANKPEKIANRVYANRMGNGNEASGDGWLYRGRGPIQLTGKDNYTAFANSLRMTALQVIGYMDTTAGAIESSLWFWKNNNLNVICDNDNVTLLSKRINGGTNGLLDRTEYYKFAKKILSE